MYLCEYSVVIASPSLQAHAGGRLGLPVPATGVYLGQPVAELVERIGLANNYTVAVSQGAIELYYPGDRAARVLNGRVIGWKP